MTALDLILLAVVTVYIVDVSGFTQSWRGALARLLRIPEQALRPLPPLDCSLCAVWWVTLIASACTRSLTLQTLALCAALSLLSGPVGNLMVTVREGLNRLIGKLQDIIGL